MILQWYSYITDLYKLIHFTDKRNVAKLCIMDLECHKIIYFPGMLNNGMVEVRYIDYGNTECSSKDTLKQISDELMTLPPQAVFCGLEGLYNPVEM